MMKVKYYKKEFIEEYFKTGKPFLSGIEHVVLEVIPCCKDVTKKFMDEAWLLGDDFLLYPKPVGDEWEIVTPRRQLYCEHCGAKIIIHKVFDITTDVKAVSDIDWKELFISLSVKL